MNTEKRNTLGKFYGNIKNNTKLFRVTMNGVVITTEIMIIK